MDNADILIIGAGAAGLMAAYTLTKAGKKVIVLEARNRCGGRIHTINNEMFFKHAELGAEFVHGDLPVTLKLLKEARIAYTNINAEMLNVKEGHFDKETEFHDEWAKLIDVLEQLEEDTTIDALLKKEFHASEFKAFKKSVINFVSGYDTANPFKASVFALLKEWKSEDNSAQHRVKGGYSRMINYLHQQTEKNNGSVLLNSPLREINWQNSDVTAITAEGKVYKASQILIAVPLGILQANPDEQGAISFNPPITKQNEAIQAMGFGAVIKILFVFNELFWEGKHAEKVAGVSLKKMGYLLSHEAVPTWWTQYPDNTPVLTGWLGGPGAAEKKDATEDEILADALQSLANIFKLDVEELKTKLIAFNIVNWTKEPFTHGSYAYDTIQSPASRKLLNEPVDSTLFFAGEYLYDGPAMGTVEAALTSGEQAAERMM